MEPNIPSPVCRKDGVEIHAAVPKDITEAFSVIAVRENGAWLLVRHSARKTWELPGGHWSRTKHRWRPHAVNYTRKRAL